MAAGTQGPWVGNWGLGEDTAPDSAAGVCEEVGPLNWMELETQTAVQGQALPL